MESEKGFIVNGFLFETAEEAQMAEKENRQIQFLESKIDYGDLQKVRAIYEKAVRDGVFRTVVGLFYLKGMRDFLVREESTLEEVLPKVPVLAGSAAGGTKPVSENGAGETNPEMESGAGGLKLDPGTGAGGIKTAGTGKSGRMRNNAQEQKKAERDYRFRVSVILNVLLVLAVIAMFVIALYADQPNILNYERAITDKYAAWEQELTEREQAVKEKELQLFREGD